MTNTSIRTCDVLVIGSGAGGLSTAITARKHGLDVIIVEKEPVFGGTTAFSGGVLWIPGNGRCTLPPEGDNREAARTYLRAETGNFYNEAAIEAFLEAGPRMLDFFEHETEVKFVPTLYPDYHPNQTGGVDIGRSVLAKPYDASQLGSEFTRLKKPLETITFVGMMFNSSNADLKHFFQVTKSATSFAYVAKRLAAHMLDLARYRRASQVTSGNALVARLARTVFNLGIPLLTSAPAQRLIIDDGRILGAHVATPDADIEIRATRGTVLACGGFPHDLKRLATAYPHIKRGAEHLSPTPIGNTGDGIRLAEEAGGNCDIRYPAPAAWMPVSRVPFGGGRFGVFPHLLDRYKPGIIAVDPRGKRFCNEADSYHDVGAAMIRACEGLPETAAWLLCDHPTIRKYGLGYAKPAPVPLWSLIRNGYLVRGNTLAELAGRIGVDAGVLETTIATYNRPAEHGEDPEFGRGTTAFNRYLADPDNKPNPCVAHIRQGPFYAVKLVMGDLGTFDGLMTDPVGRVLRSDGLPIEGLYAVGNDRASIMGGNYPGAGITLGPIMTFGWLTGRHLAGLSDILAETKP